MSNRIIRLLWDETYVRDHAPELEDSFFLPPFDLPYEIYDEESGTVLQKGILEGLYLSRITMNADTQEYTICKPVEISDFTGDSQEWHAVHSEMVSEPCVPKKEPN